MTWSISVFHLFAFNAPFSPLADQGIFGFFLKGTFQGIAMSLVFPARSKFLSTFVRVCGGVAMAWDPSVLHCVVVCCSVLLCVAVCFSVSQCAAVCCSVLQCVAGVAILHIRIYSWYVLRSDTRNTHYNTHCNTRCNTAQECVSYSKISEWAWATWFLAGVQLSSAAWCLGCAPCKTRRHGQVV